MNETTPENQDSQGAGSEVDLEQELAGGAGKKPNKNVFILVGLGVLAAGVIWFMYLRPGPQTAAAAPASGPGGSEIKDFLDGGHITQMKQTLKDTEKLVQQFRAFPGATQVPLASLKSNPFRELEPVEGAAPKQADDDEAKEHTKVVTAVSELHLQSIMRGAKHRSCMINNMLYSEGGQVGVFKITSVQPAAVVLESGKYRFELKMQN
ncbi:MAG TPA: hypothetical protein VLJ39_07830 [Tepidisphaeraceae bacterium]|nr:hypothetical protein [Tepidisphaeraceae bacterium]